MACYTIAHVTITDPDGYAVYAADAPETIARHGGEYVVRGGHATDIEGQMPGARHIVLRWPDRAAAEAWYNSPEYQAIVPARRAASTGAMVFVDGVEE